METPEVEGPGAVKGALGRLHQEPALREALTGEPHVRGSRPRKSRRQ